jgi:regulatory protein
VKARGRRRPAPTARQPESAEAAYAEAVKRLARQPQSRATLAHRLTRVGYSEAAVKEALDRAQASGYLDDREFAAAMVRRRAAGRGHALIAQELRSRGIGDAEADAALGQLDPEGEAEQALSLGRRLLAGKHPADPQAVLAAVGPRLTRRGFSSGLVYRVCRTLTDELEAAGAFDRV